MPDLSDSIRTEQLTFAYGTQLALQGIDLRIEAGSFFGLLGPNGAGKSTFIHILSTLLPPASGKVWIKEVDLCEAPDKVKKILGIVPQEIALYAELSAIDNLIFWGRLYGLSLAECRSRATYLLKRVGLETRMKDQVGHYSGGMKRRVNLAVALMHQPSILLMDEPTVGVDPQSRNHIFDLLQELHQEGMTILYTTHYMEEVERLCQKAAIIDHGRIIAQGDMDELREMSKGHASVDLHVQEAGTDFLKRLNDQCKFPVEAKDNLLVFKTPTPQLSLSQIIQEVLQAGGKIDKVEIRAPNLESVFLDLTGRRLRD